MTNIIDENDFIKKLTVFVSNGETLVTLGNNIITQNYSNGIILIVIKDNIIKYNQIFKTSNNVRDIIKLMKVIDYIQNNDLIIIASVGNAFNILLDNKNAITKEFIKKINEIGGKIKLFRENDNYLLITRKLKDIYYEKISSDPVYFPDFDIQVMHCKKNPYNIFPPKKYYIFNNKSYEEYNFIKCAIETNLRNLGKFGLFNNICVPMTDNNYNETKQISFSDNCIPQIGGNALNELDAAISIYEINKIYSTKIPNNIDSIVGVIFFGDNNYYIFNEGIYEKQDINRFETIEIYVPTNYFLILVLDHDIIPIYGPKKENIKKLDLINKINTIIVQKNRTNNGIICGIIKDKLVCLTYSPGIHILLPKLFMVIHYVNLQNLKGINLYSNIEATDLIENFNRSNTLEKIIKVKFPRIVRSVKMIE